MRDYMNEDWGGGGQQAVSPYAATQLGMSAPPMPPPGQAQPWSHMPSMPAVKTGGGFPKWILAPLILVLVGGGFFVTKGRAMLAARSAAAATTSASAVTPTAAKVPTPTPETPAKAEAKTDTTTATPAAPAAASSPAPAAKAKTKKKK